MKDPIRLAQSAAQAEDKRNMAKRVWVNSSKVKGYKRKGYYKTVG